MFARPTAHLFGYAAKTPGSEDPGYSSVAASSEAGVSSRAKEFQLESKAVNTYYATFAWAPPPSPQPGGKARFIRQE